MNTHFLMKNDEAPHITLCGVTHSPRKMTHRRNAVDCPGCLEAIGTISALDYDTALQAWAPHQIGADPAELTRLKFQHRLTPNVPERVDA